MAKIFIVEDDVDLVDTYTDLLQLNGHSVYSTSRISEANTCILDLQPEVITLDLNLPGNSGSTISNFIQTAKTLLRQCKIIVISGHTEMISGQLWINDVDLVLTKPVDNQHLTRMIDRLLSI